MNPTKNTARYVGMLYLIGTLSGILSFLPLGPFLNRTQTMAMDINQTQIALGTLFILIMGLALSMVPILLFPYFKKYSEALALGAVVFRGALETLFYMIVMICWLTLSALSQDVSNAPFLQSHSSFIYHIMDQTGILLSISFSIGALFIYRLFYISKLIPNWLSLWGLVGGLLYLAYPLLLIFNYDFEILMAPLAIQEMALAAWLMIKGFNPAPRPSTICD